MQAEHVDTAARSVTATTPQAEPVEGYPQKALTFTLTGRVARLNGWSGAKWAVVH